MCIWRLQDFGIRPLWGCEAENLLLLKANVPLFPDVIAMACLFGMCATWSCKEISAARSLSFISIYAAKTSKTLQLLSLCVSDCWSFQTALQLTNSVASSSPEKDVWELHPKMKMCKTNMPHIVTYFPWCNTLNSSLSMLGV